VQQWRKDKEQLLGSSFTTKVFCSPEMGHYEEIGGGGALFVLNKCCT
jgi:hypothetical protein